jgi:tetratricopeptide (TPR) repeat protein
MSALQQQNRSTQAAEVFREEVALRLKPETKLCTTPDDRVQLQRTYTALGIALAASRQTEKAVAAYVRALAVADKLAAELPAEMRYQQLRALNRNNLARLLATCPETKLRDATRAIELAKTAVDLTPNEHTFRNTLGVACYRTGNWKAAIEALEKSMELNSGDGADDWIFLATAHWQLGSRDQARIWLGRAVESMDKDGLQDQDLRRSRAEAEELLGSKTARAANSGRL